MSITLEMLGLTQEELQDRVVKTAADQLLNTVTHDEDGDEVAIPSDLSRRVRKEIEIRIDAAVKKVGEEKIGPMVESLVRGATLQATNKWGEKKGEPVTFTEYLVQRADAYLREDVDLNGKGREEANGYSWTKSTTRVAYMVNHLLKYSIEGAMQTALKDANSAIVGGIDGAVKQALANVVATLKTTVSVTP